MTNEQIKKVKVAILETENLLSKELSYSKDLQKTEKVSFYKAHIIKLQKMISND